VDCSQSIGNKGCNWGYYTYAWFYLEVSGGIESSAAYPYTAMVYFSIFPMKTTHYDRYVFGQDGQCQFDKSKVIAKVPAVFSINKNDEAMKFGVALVGPFSVAIFANSNFMSYQLGSKFTRGFTHLLTEFD
jgi:Papain family cysteine protease